MRDLINSLEKKHYANTDFKRRIDFPIDSAICLKNFNYTFTKNLSLIIFKRVQISLIIIFHVFHENIFKSNIKFYHINVSKLAEF